MDRIESKREKRPSQKLWSYGERPNKAKLVSSKKHAHSNEKTSPQTSPVSKKTPSKEWNPETFEKASTNRSVVLETSTTPTMIKEGQKQKSPHLNLTELGEISPFGDYTQFNHRGRGRKHSNNDNNRSFLPRTLVIQNSTTSPPTGLKSTTASSYSHKELAFSSKKPTFGDDDDCKCVMDESSRDDWKSPSPNKPSTATCKGTNNACFSSQDVRYSEFLAITEGPSQPSAAYERPKNDNNSPRKVILHSHDDQSSEKTSRCIIKAGVIKHNSDQEASFFQNNKSRSSASASFKAQNNNSNKRNGGHSSQDVRNVDFRNQTRRLSQSSIGNDVTFSVSKSNRDLTSVSNSPPFPTGSVSSRRGVNLNGGSKEVIVTSEDISGSEHFAKMNKHSNAGNVTRINEYSSDQNAVPTTNKTPTTTQPSSFKRHYDFKSDQQHRDASTTPDVSVRHDWSSETCTGVEDVSERAGRGEAQNAASHKTKQSGAGGDLTLPYKRHYNRWDTPDSFQDKRDFHPVKQSTKVSSRRSYPNTCRDAGSLLAVSEATERQWYDRQENCCSDYRPVTTSEDKTTAVDNSLSESASSQAVQRRHHDGRKCLTPQDSSSSRFVKEAKKSEWVESFTTTVKKVAAKNELRHNAWKAAPFASGQSTAATSFVTPATSKPSTNQWKPNSFYSQGLPAFQYVDPASESTESTSSSSAPQQVRNRNKWRASYSPQSTCSSESASTAKRHCCVVSPETAAANEVYRVVGRSSPLVGSASTTPNGTTAFTNQWRSSMSPLQNVPAFQYSKQPGVPSSRLPYIDTHCHLDLISKRFHRINTFGEFQVEFDFPDNFQGCIAVFCYPKDWIPGYGSNFIKKMLAHKQVWAAIGCHPKDASSFDNSKMEILKTLLANPKVVAVGEMGLDYSKQHFQDQQNLQKEVFRKQLSLAKSFNKPVVVHCRDAEEDAIEVLKESGCQNTRIHRHCFTEGWEEAVRWLEEFPNCYLGITCIITKWDRQPRLAEAVRRIPLNRLLLETDAPYFVPKSVVSEVNYSVPCMALDVAACIAELKGLTLDQVLEVTWQNSLKMYGLQIET